MLEDSPRRELEKASSPVPSPKAVAPTPPHYVRTAQFSERQYILSDHLRESEAAGELSASHTRVKRA